MGCVVKAMPGRFIPGKDLAPIVQGAWSASEQVRTDAEYLATNGGSIPGPSKP